MDALADNRIERRTNGQRHVQAIREVAECHTHQGVECPTGHTIVEEREHHCLTCSFDGLRISGRRAIKLCHRLRYREEEQVNADTRRKEHRGPGEQTKLRLGVIGAELNLPCSRDSDVEHEEHCHRRGHNIEPAEVLRYPGDNASEGIRCIVRGKNSPQSNGENANA